jgi:hypothetical protein
MINSPLPSISISCIETRHHEKAAKALMQTLYVCKDLSVERVYWLSDSACPAQGAIEQKRGKDFIEWVRIEPFDLEASFNNQLSHLTLDVLPRAMQTEFNLLIQVDGYAVNADAWTNRFFDYDYIGATWPKEPEGRNVGNGGFSWRSKKLYQAIIDLRSKYSIEDFLQGSSIDETWFDKFGGRSIPEDNLIAKIYRPILESEYGARFAPSELADQFSIETNANSPWIGQSFGFHGRLAGSFYMKPDL